MSDKELISRKIWKIYYLNNKKPNIFDLYVLAEPKSTLAYKYMKKGSLFGSQQVEELGTSVLHHNMAQGITW